MAFHVDIEAAIRREIDRAIDEAAREEMADLMQRIHARVQKEVAAIALRVAGMVDLANDRRCLIITIKDATVTP